MTYNHIAPNYAGTGRNYRQPLYEPAFIESKTETLANGYAFHRYEKEALNNTLVPWYEWQSRHLHMFGVKNNKPEGLAIIWHGGGGDVGYCEHPEIIEKALHLVGKGFVACVVEYRRGWTNTGFKNDEANPDSAEVQRDLFNLTSEEYKRQESSARLSFEDAQTALDFLCAKYPEAARKGIVMEGTSFGGAIVLALTVMNPKAELYNFMGAVAGFGGINAADIRANKGKLPSPKACPLVLIGGTADPIVPFWEGPYYCQGEVYGLGSAAVAELVRAGGGQAQLIGTVNKGHGYGAVNHSIYEQFTILEKAIKTIKAGKPINSTDWYSLENEKAVRATEAEALAAFNARCEILNTLNTLNP